MLIILEKNGKQQRVSVENHIAQRDRVEFDVAPSLLIKAKVGAAVRPITMTRETYHRAGRTHDGAPVFEYRAPVRWVAARCSTAYEIKIDCFKLRVFRWKSDSWFATCEGLFSRHELKSRDLEDAKAEALGLVRNILNAVLIDMEALPCR